VKTIPKIGVIWLALIAVASAFAQGVPTQIQTQQLVLLPQAPVPAVAQVTAAPSVQGSTTYYYWFVSHQGAVVSAPAGPFLVNNAPASLGGINIVTINWTPPAVGLTYDVLRTSTTAAPIGACACAIASGVTLTSLVDSSAATSAYTVATSLSQIPVVCTNTATCGSTVTGVTVGAPNQNDIYLSPNCGLSPALGNCFQIHDDVRQIASGCSWLINSPNVHCTLTTAFTSTAVDAGKDFGGYQSCQTNSGPNANGLNPGYRLDFPAGTTIVSVTDSQDVVVSNNSTSAENLAIAGCVMYGTPDDTGFAAAKAFWLNASQCFSVNLPSGIWALKDPHNFFGSNSQFGEPQACFQSGASVGEGAGASYAITGTNPATSIMWLPPDFVSSNCNSQSEYGNACFWNSNGLWRNFQVTTGGLGTFSFASKHVIFASAGQVNGVTNFNQFAFFDNFYCVNVVPLDGNAIGFSTGLWWTELRFVYSDGCGGVGLQDANANAPIKLLDTKIEDNCCGAAQFGGATSGNLLSMGGNQFWDGPLYSAGQPVLVGNITLATGDAIFKNGATSAKCWGGNGILVISAIGVGVSCNEPTGIQTGAVTDVMDLTGWQYTGTGTGINVLNATVRIFSHDSSTGSIVGNSHAPTLHDRGFNAFGTVSADVVITCDVPAFDAFCQISLGTTTLSAGAGSHTFTTAYTTQTAPLCFAQDVTTPANSVACSITGSAGAWTAISLTGTGTDVVKWSVSPAQN